MDTRQQRTVILRDGKQVMWAPWRSQFASWRTFSGCGSAWEAQVESCGHLQFRRYKLKSGETQEANIKGQNISKKRSHNKKTIDMCWKALFKCSAEYGSCVPMKKLPESERGHLKELKAYTSLGIVHISTSHNTRAHTSRGIQKGTQKSFTFIDVH